MSVFYSLNLFYYWNNIKCSDYIPSESRFGYDRVTWFLRENCEILKEFLKAWLKEFLKQCLEEFLKERLSIWIPGGTSGEIHREIPGGFPAETLGTFSWGILGAILRGEFPGWTSEEIAGGIPLAIPGKHPGGIS